MHNIRLHDAISTRKSVRKYLSTPLSALQLTELQKFLSQLTPLFPDIPVEFKVVSRQETIGIVSVSAPHYLALFTPEGVDAELNAGFMLQQADLYFSVSGFGSCWLGMTKLTREAQDRSALPFLIMLAFGIPAESARRNSASEFKRRKLEDICTPGVMPELIQSARLAPSAMNKQPWYFTGGENHCRAFTVHGSGLLDALESWKYIDLGIAISQLSVSALALGKKMTFRREDSIPALQGKEYLISCFVQ